MIGLDTVIEGVLLGGVYALFALGLSLIFVFTELFGLCGGDDVFQEDIAFAVIGCFFGLVDRSGFDFERGGGGSAHEVRVVFPLPEENGLFNPFFILFAHPWAST